MNTFNEKKLRIYTWIYHKSNPINNTEKLADMKDF